MFLPCQSSVTARSFHDNVEVLFDTPRFAEETFFFGFFIAFRMTKVKVFNINFINFIISICLQYLYIFCIMYKEKIVLYF